MLSYRQKFLRSIEKPIDFWAERSSKLTWFKQPTSIMKQHPSKPNNTVWFDGGMTNQCFNCIDRHLPKFKDNTALIAESFVTKDSRSITYGRLHEDVQALASFLKASGIKKGDRVLIYMPMIYEAVLSMLACARLGAIHVVVFGGFAAPELAKRIKFAEPAMILTATGSEEASGPVPYLPKVKTALDITGKDIPVVVKSRCENTENLPQLHEYPKWKNFDEQMYKYNGHVFDAVPVESNHPLYIIYTSGTTGNPKGIVRETGDFMVALDFTM